MQDLENDSWAPGTSERVPFFIEINREILYAIFYRIANVDDSRNWQLAFRGSTSKMAERMIEYRGSLGEASKANYTIINNSKK